jgi:hypothetical protein
VLQKENKATDIDITHLNYSYALDGSKLPYCVMFQNLVFAILLANNQLITLVCMKKYFIHPADLHLILNLVNSSESLKAAESWTPICLPKFDSRLV